MYEGVSPIGKMSQDARTDSERWFGDQPQALTVPHMALALAGEVGEFCNVVKKIERGSLSGRDAAVRHELISELTDVLTYTLALAGVLNADIGKMYEIVRANNEKRFVAARLAREATAKRSRAEENNVRRLFANGEGPSA